MEDEDIKEDVVKEFNFKDNLDIMSNSAATEYLNVPGRLTVYQTAARGSILGNLNLNDRNRAISTDKFNGKGQNMDFYFFELKNSRGKSMQDRVLAIEDLYGHVCSSEVRDAVFKGYFAQHPVLKNFDWNALERDCKIKEPPNLKLFGIFDGHGGQFASTFCTTVFAFELIAVKELLAKKQFEEAVKQAIENMHRNLINFDAYTWEADESWCAAGTTVSVALVSDNSTIFGCLGDSPIYVTHKSGKVEPVFRPQSSKSSLCLERVISSRSPVGHYESGMLSLKFKIYTSEEASKKDVYAQIDRVSLAGLNCWGSVGDSIADPEIFNALITEIIEFKAQIKKEKTDSVGKLKYKHFVRFLKGRPSFGLLRKHMILVEDSRAAPFPLTHLLKTKSDQEQTPHSPLLRVPEIKKFSNSSISGFHIASDGVSDFEDADFLQRTLEFHPDHLECAKVLKSAWNTNTGDDRSAIMAWFV